MHALIKFTVLAVIWSQVRSDFPLDIDEPLVRNTNNLNYRLPEDLDPQHYEIELTPYFLEAPAGREPFTFDGRVTITIRAVREGLTSLIIQENVREILGVTLTDANEVPILLNENNPWERIREYHFLRVNLRDGVTLATGQDYLLTVVYLGNINETPLSRGMFRGSYLDSNNQRHWYAATHLQPTNSRQAFPSFDEPGFKSTFDIIINRPLSYTQSFSNMDLANSTVVGDRVREVFYRTPRMSAYLVSVHISDEYEVIAEHNDPARPYRILGRPNARGQGDYALEVGPPITSWLDTYFNISYYDMAPGIKNDQVGSPDWASGATENWGLVTYRELRLFYQEGETNALDKMYVGTITAHELAHKWFGNLITCRWWDNVWINEGFASYFEYFAMHGVDRSLELEDQFNIMYLQSALSADQSASTRALQHTVNSPTEVTGHFSGISYSKGASLLLMLKYLVTEDVFKRALTYFLLDRQYEHAFPSDLYRNFARAVSEEPSLNIGTDISEFMRYWVEEQGYPVLTVNVNMQTGVMNLQQERFFISATATPTDQAWPLPLTYTTGNNPNWENLRAERVMTTRTDQIQKAPGHEWVIFNVQQRALYRVDYDTHNWEMIASALRTNPSSIHYLNRAQIVDDVFAFMRSERMTFELGFQILDFLKQETNYYVWYPAVTGFNWIRNRFLHLPDALAEFDEILFEFLDAVVTDLTYDVGPNEPLTRTLNRFFVMSFACNIGHSGCVEDAAAKFRALVNNGQSVNPNIRRHVFCTGLLQGGYNDWEFLYNRRVNTENQADETVMLRALGCTTDDRARQRYLEMILSSDVRAQDSVNAFTFFHMGDRENSKVALQFLKLNIDAVRQKTVLPAWFNNVLSNLAAYLDEEGLADMQSWLEENQDTIPEYATGISAITGARNNMAWGTQRADRILSAARGAAAHLLPTTMLLLTALYVSLFR